MDLGDEKSEYASVQEGEANPVMRRSAISDYQSAVSDLEKSEKMEALPPVPGKNRRSRRSWRSSRGSAATSFDLDRFEKEALEHPLPAIPSKWEAKTTTNNERRTSRLDLSEELTALPTFSELLAGYTAGARASQFLIPEQLEPTAEYPKSWRLAAIMTALCFAVFCMALDNTIISTAIPSITNDFHAIDDIAWYITAYFLMTCSFQLFFGRLYTFFNVKMVFLVAMALFELGSLICGVAPNSPSLIVGRAIAGVGSAGIFSGAILIVAAICPLHKRPLYVGLAASMYGIASVVGPLLGGVFTDRLSWRWCFFINLPFGAVTILFLVFFFRNPPSGASVGLTLKEKMVKLDLLGLVIFIPATVCLILALQWGGLYYDWSDWRIILMLVLFGILTLVFIGWQFWRQENATVPPRIIKQRSVGGAAWWAFMFGGSFFIFVYYVPIWFQGVQGTSATRSGINSLPLVLSSSLFAGLSGVMITVWGYYTPLLIASSVLSTIGSGLISTFSREISVGRWVGYQFLAGTGFGLGIQIPLIVVQAVLDVKDIPTGTAVIMFAQTLGGALFLAVSQNIWLAELGVRIVKIVPGFDIKTLIKTGGATNIREFLSGDLLLRVLDAYSAALDHAFYAGTALAALSILGALVVEWKSVKGQFLMGAG